MKQKTRLKTQNSKPFTANLTPLAEGLRKKPKPRNWGALTDQELIQHAKTFVKLEGISTRESLKNTDSGLHESLRKRGLLGRIGLGRKKRKDRSWKLIKDEELTEHTKTFMEEKGLTGRAELEKADSGLYDVLKKRGLLDSIGFEEKTRSWKQMKDEEVIEYAIYSMKEKGIITRTELFMADPKLYKVLMKRGLMDNIGFEEKQRNWASMSDNELIEHSKKFMIENEISARSELYNADPGLYGALRKRKLLDKIDFEKKQRKSRPWNQMKDFDLIEYTKTFMKGKGVFGRNELKNADPGLYEILRMRKLLDLVFADIERFKQQENERNRLLALSQAAEAMEQFGERR